MSGDVDVLRFRPRAAPGLRASVKVGDHTVDAPAWVDLCLAASAAGAETLSGERMERDGLRLAVKAGSIASSGGRRHLARRWSTGRPAPCESEFDNLRWLRARLFRTPAPVLAVTLTRHGVPVAQLLATEWVERAAPLKDAWSRADNEERAALATELGRELGRMHALRFVHGDAYPRNLLVTPALEKPSRAGASQPDSSPVSGDLRRIVWLDAWSGGPHGWPRGSGRSPEHDLGAWLSQAVDWTTDGDRRRVLASYVQARGANGRAVQRVDRWLQNVAKARRNELVRLESARGRLRGQTFPRAGWCPPDPATLNTTKGPA